MFEEDLVKRLSGPGNEGRSRLRGRMGKLGIEGRKIDLGKLAVGRFHGRDSLQGDLLGKTLLMGPEAPFTHPQNTAGLFLCQSFHFSSKRIFLISCSTVVRSIMGPPWTHS